MLAPELIGDEAWMSWDPKGRNSGSLSEFIDEKRFAPKGRGGDYKIEKTTQVKKQQYERNGLKMHKQSDATSSR